LVEVISSQELDMSLRKEAQRLLRKQVSSSLFHARKSVPSIFFSRIPWVAAVGPK
jgi:hypothetical protein